MNLRRQRPSDSLDMLLDTMCNTFGGIIMLAVLVTLLISKEQPGHAASAADTQEMLQRRLALAQSNLRNSEQLLASLEAKAGNERWKAQVTKLSARQELQNEIKRLRELTDLTTKETDSVASKDPAERMKILNAQLADAQARKLEAQNSLAASQAKAKQLNTRLTDLEKRAVDLVNESQRQLRLPKEHDTGKRVIYFIARYGRIYPCRNADLSQNETDIEWTSGLSSEVASPKPGKGMDPVAHAARLKAYFGSQSPGSVYVAFCVFEDSFPAFIRAKQLAVESGIAYGWEPYQFADGPVTFSAVGHTPKPQ